MYLTQLEVQGIRNILDASLSPVSGINILCGENGSGKTSLLEAIYLLGRGRTFRSRHTKTLINHQSGQCTVFGRASNKSLPGLGSYTIGVSRQASGAFQFKVAGKKVNAASSLVQAAPLLLMNSDSFLLVEGGPGGRRRFLDWGVFHVEQGFQALWTQFQRSLYQRNKLLRHGKMASAELTSWDDSFVRLSEELSAMRRCYFDKIEPLFKGFIETLTGISGVGLFFQQGWDEGLKLGDVLQDGLQQDFRRQVTGRGPHRADIKIMVNGRAASEVLSRGQIKALVAALIIGQGEMFSISTQRQCMFLFDDLLSELDGNYLERAVSLLADSTAQVFITGTDYEPITKILSRRKDENYALFHVEHGEIKAIDQATINQVAQGL